MNQGKRTTDCNDAFQATALQKPSSCADNYDKTRRSTLGKCVCLGISYTNVFQGRKESHIEY